ncbi:uncharacterized protein KY384_001873 [Bacidia gigantensis]|uniref:uncharacterized protein n=1 Tax=Bacidia gigantensis TaxID=2732470 RepID=UPI001D054D28|nr:uncharacterized protein KY384_001873 [Bacidia gigantensis]KAG8533090.1 hypothetical protein KY384_001873 [Bacidia gigantensis]
MELDEIEGNNDWKAAVESTDYDATLVQARLKQMTEARISCDIGKMLFLVRTSLTRNLGDMGNQQMYRHSHIGTKDLVENYITATLDTLEALLDVSAKAKCDGLESRYILEQLLSSRQAFGRSALLLSGGGTFGMNHIGVLKALWEVRLLPRIISGASAGSIVCAVICTRSDEEVPNLLDTFCDGSLDVFEEEGSEDGLLRKVARFLKHGALYDIEHLTRIMRDLLGEITFQEAYNRTRKILNITVSSASLYELPRLLNYITAPNVLIWSAVAASCSVPFVYTAASLLAKDPKTGEAVTWNPTPQQWIDGSVDNDIPMTRLAEMFNVNHFIVSQVNPHVVPFLMKDEGLMKKSPQEATINPTVTPSWLDSLSHLAKDEALHRMHMLTDLGIFPNLLTKMVSVLSQKYSGDITILPEISYADFPRILSNPTPDFMQQAMLAGERATWPKISIIKNHCAIELALDDAVQKLRTRVVFSPVEVESRKGAHVKRNSLTGSHRTIRKRASNGRPLSQASAQEPLQGRPPSSQSDHRRSPLSILDPRNPNQIPRLRHKKSRSLNTVLARPTSSHTNLHKSQLPTADTPAQPRSSQEITSSGAEEETSNHPSRTSSSTSLNLSSPYESQSSMGESPPSRWHRSLFGSSSQPNTPRPYAPSNKSSPTTPKASLPPTPTMTSAQGSKNGSESRYKRMFLPKQQKQKQKAAAEVPKPKSGTNSHGGSGGESAQSGNPGPRRNWGLEIDIPSTARGLVGRGSKSKERTRSP